MSLYLKILYFFYSLGLFFTPFYFWSSGVPQISHIILSVFALGALIISDNRFQTKEIYIGVLFVTYCLFVGLLVYERYKDFRSILGPIYFLFNIIILFSIRFMIKINFHKFLRITKYIFFISIILLVIIVFSGNDKKLFGPRSAGWFNDPNQMSYWLLCSSSIIGYIKINKQIDNWAYAYFLIAFLLIAKSISRSGLIGFCAFILFFLLIDFRELVKAKIIYKALGIILFTLFIFLNLSAFKMKPFPMIISVEDIRQNYVMRFQERDIDDSMPGRGYDRLWLYPEELIFGAGEGAVDRFGHSLAPGEIHSSFANLLFSYGIIGFVLFMALFINLFGNLSRTIKCLPFYVGPFAWGLFTYGLRNSMFWILLAYISYGYSQKTKNRKDLCLRIFKSSP